MEEAAREKDERKAIGGHARAQALAPEQRSAIAARAAIARWSGGVPQATHGSEDHPLKIGDAAIPCYVLEDGRRVIVQRGMFTALDMKQGTAGRGAGDRLAKFIATKSINPFVSGQLAEMIINPIRFRTPGGLAYGYEATILADLCDAVLTARKEGRLNYQQEHIAAQCEILVRAFARVGIIALVDEATGYQEVRDRLALQAILDRFLRKELAAWAKRFPDEFYQEIFRLRGWPWKGMAVNRPRAVGLYTKDIVYARLAPGILKQLEERNPKDEKGNRKARHHQWLTEDIGHPALSQHLHAVLAFMRATPTGPTAWKQFMAMLNRAFPKRGDTLELPFMHDDGTAHV